MDNGFDQINVTGEATLDGTLAISLINDFIPALNDTFDFLTFGTISGSFSQVTGPFDFGDSGLYFEVVEQSDRLQLVVAEIPTEQDLHITTSATNRMEEAIEGLADDADTLLSDLLLANPDITGQTLPGTDVSLDELFDLADYLDIGPALDDYVTPMQELGSDLRFEIDEFLNYLRGSWLDDLLGGQAYDIDFTSKTYTGEYDWIDGITVEFSGSATFGNRIMVGLSDTIEGIGPAYTEYEATIDAAFGFTLGLRWADGTGDYEFEVTQLELDAEINSLDLVIPFTIGDLEAAAGHPQHTQGTLGLGVHLDLLYDTPGDEYIVTRDPVADDVSFVDLDLPIYAMLRLPVWM